MVEVTYYCPHCGAVTSLDRDGYMADRSVTEQPLEGWEYASPTDDYEAADGVELVCLGDATPDDERDADAIGDATVGDGCGRTFYLNFVRYEQGRPVDPGGGWLEDDPNFDFLR